MLTVANLAKEPLLRLKNFTTECPHRPPPQEAGWVQFWHGYFQMVKVRSEKKRATDINTHNIPEYAARAMQEGELERQLFLNIIHNIGKDNINMFELGAGRGDWCLSLAGVVDFGLVPTRAGTYRCLALEGEPTHYEWTKEHFAVQQINGAALHGAIQAYNGVVKFNAQAAPADDYGQSVNEKGNVYVPCCSIDTLMERYSFDNVDIVHTDVQGAEYDALLGASKAIQSRAIDYFLIGTHTPQLNAEIRKLLERRYHFIVDIPCGAGLVDTPLGQAWIPVDGCMLLQRKGLGQSTFDAIGCANSLGAEKSPLPSPQSIAAQCAPGALEKPRTGVGDDGSNIQTQEELAAYILSQNPGLMECLKSWDIIGAVLTLREWTSSLINITEEPLLFEPLDVVSAFHTFREKKQGVWCGGAGKFFKWVLHLFAIPAARFNYARPQHCSLSHLTTLFCDMSDDSFPVYVADAYLNYHYVDSDTHEMLRLETLLQYIARKQYHRIKTAYSPVHRSRISSEEIPVGYKGMREIAYPERRRDAEAIRRDGLWEYPNGAITWASIMREFNTDFENYDLYKAGRTDEELYFDLMLNKTLVDKFDLPEVDARMDRLFEGLGTNGFRVSGCS